MRTQRPVVLAILITIAVLLLSAGPVAADGPVTRFTGVVDILGPAGDPPAPTALPGGRLMFEDWVLSPSHYLASDPRVTGWGTVTINGILQPGGTWMIWGTVDWDLDGYTDADSWEGGYLGTMIFTDEGIHANIVAEYQGTGALAGQRMRLLQKNRGTSITFSGSIFEHPDQ